MADQFDHSGNDLPKRLEADLASLYENPGAIPSRVDDAILNRARAELARPRAALRRRWGWAAIGASAAAACLLAVLNLRHPNQLARNPDEPVVAHKVDIVDALKLARQIEAGSGRDINDDGAVDQRDVDALAMIAVRLDGGIQ